MTDDDLQVFANLLEIGQNILVGEVQRSQIGPNLRGWVLSVGTRLRYLPEGSLLRVDWMGLPIPFFYGGEFDSVEVQRCVEIRLAWLARTVRALAEGAKPEGLVPQMVPTSGRKPRLFIGSSGEGIQIARAIELNLQRDAEITLWSHGVFGLGEGPLEAILQASRRYDFAALVITPDDVVESRGEARPSARDNVLFELGVFMGRIGRMRTFIVYNRDAKVKLPSDLAGVTRAEYGDRSDGNIRAQVSPACTEMTERIEKLKLFDPVELTTGATTA